MNKQASRRDSDDLENHTYLPQDDEVFFAKEEKPLPDSPVSNSRPFATESPGTQMKALREARKLSVEEVAKRLYLDAQMIKNLEADNYAHLPPPIFVQGYLRAVAKLFEVPEEPLLSAYLKYNPNAHLPPALASENTVQMPKVGVGHASGRWWFYATWALLLGLTALVAWRYTMQTPPPARNGDSLPIENTSNSSSESLIAPPAPYTPPSEGGGTKSTASSPAPAGTPALSTTPAPVAMIAPPTSMSLTSMTGMTGMMPSAPTPSAALSPTTSMNSTGSTTTSPSETTPTPPAPTEDASGLILKFKEVSWARVVDSKEKKLYDGTSKPGQTVIIKEGVPPYEVSFNKVATVEMFYKGQLMDLAPYKNDRTVTLSVGDSPNSATNPDEEEE
ncbi:MAG: hypothetical protein RIT27_700 [Pseudomonadota bacterium]|jgi:cytoskeleton protein RodZ